MQRIIKLAALLLIAALFLTGCMDFSALQNELANASDPAAEPTAEPTVPPLTAPIYTDKDAAYEIYNAVNIGDTYDSLVERYGEPIVEEDSNGKMYTWTNEAGYGITAIFYDNNCLRAKVIYYEDIRQLKDLSLATSITNFSLLSTDHDFSMVCMALGGTPLELTAVAQDTSVNPEIHRVFVWLDEFGSFVQVRFDAKEKLKQVTYSLADKTE